MLRFTIHSLLTLTIASTATMTLATTLYAQEHIQGGSTSSTLSDCPDCQAGAHGDGACPSCGRLGGGGLFGPDGLIGRAKAFHYAPNCRTLDTHNPDLFYNYYVPPTCGGIGAELYKSPGPVPAHVGSTYYTYQPLYPHEYLYQHKRTYHRYYNNGRGLNRTHVKWTTPPGSGALSVLHSALRLPR